MKPFNKSDWEKLMNRIIHLDIQTLEDTYDKPGGNVVNIRHDVDDNIEDSMVMAVEEYEMDIKSTYFILDTSPYWDKPETIKQIQFISRFQNIGWHNNFITRRHHYGVQQAQFDTLKNLELLRTIYPVIGTASHGDNLCHEKKYINYYMFGLDRTDNLVKFPNKDEFNLYNLSDFGLHYEAYFTGHTHYISDSGGKWQQDNEKVILDFERNGGKLQILIHPQHWKL